MQVSLPILPKSTGMRGSRAEIASQVAVTVSVDVNMKMKMIARWNANVVLITTTIGQKTNTVQLAVAR